MMQAIPKYFPKRNASICSHKSSEMRSCSGCIEESKLEKNVIQLMNEKHILIQFYKETLLINKEK